MAMVCPKCLESYPQRLNCPSCGVRLQYQALRNPRSAGGEDADDAWQQTPWGRLVVGLLLAQGGYYVLRHLYSAGVLVIHPPGDGDTWAALTSLIILQALQGVSVFAGGVLSGAGERRGLLLGAVVGLWHGVLFVAAQHWNRQPMTNLHLVGEPLLQSAIGAAGGLVGGLIWRPIPDLIIPADLRVAQPLLPARRPGPSSFDGPIAWARVVTGMAVAIGGIVWVDVIREFVIDASEGKLQIDTHLQAELVTWEISALAMLTGSGLAGSTTRNGMKQGLVVGLGTAIVLLGVRLASGTATPQIAMVIGISALGLGLSGGWFGSQLLPPIDRSLQRKRRPRPV